MSSEGKKPQRSFFYKSKDPNNMDPNHAELLTHLRDAANHMQAAKVVLKKIDGNTTPYTMALNAAITEKHAELLDVLDGGFKALNALNAYHAEWEKADKDAGRDNPH
jgi:hypothetical protein